MIEFAFPWLYGLLLLPPLFYWIVPVYKERRDAVRVPFFSMMVQLSGLSPSKGAVRLKRSRLQLLLLIIGWFSLITALAKPQWIGEPIEQIKAAREIMVALDLSGSMIEEDFTDKNGVRINRLDAAKQVLSEFARERQHDRLGLILFGDAAYMQAPFTEDIETWLALLHGTELGVAGWQTAIGDAIGLSIGTFENDQTENRVLILLTDGYDTGSKMPPIKAAQIAKDYNIKIYTIAMGDPSLESEYQLDTVTLSEIARITGGVSFQAIDRSELAQVYQQINELEKQLYETLSFRPRTSLHHLSFSIYILANLILLMPALIKRYRNWRRVRQEINLLEKEMT